MLNVKVGKGRSKTVVSFPNLNRINLVNMTERTQLMMFGEVIQRRYDHSIHPNRNRRSA